MGWRVLVRASILCALLALCACGDDDRLKAAAASNERTKGDNAFKIGQLKVALEHYSKAIEMNPKDHQSYYKRASAYMIDRKYDAAIRDLNKALEIEPSFTQALAKRGRVFAGEGRFDDARKDFHALLAKKGGNDPDAIGHLQKIDQAANALNHARNFKNQGAWDAAKQHYDQALEVAPDSLEILMERAEVRWQLRDTDGVLLDTGLALKVRGTHIPALHLRGMTYYLADDFELAQRHFREGLRTDPDNKECKAIYRRIKGMLNLLKSADEELKTRKFDEAIADYTKASQMDPAHRLFNARMYLGVCRCRVKMRKDYRAAVADCSKYMETLQEGEGNKEDRIEAFVQRAEAHLFGEDFEEAVRDYERAHHLSGDQQHVNEGLENAKKRLKMSKRKDYYKILDISPGCDERTIRKAYKRLALKWHPDKHQSEADKEAAEKKFREVAEAHEILTDPEKRARFDNGEDVEAPPQQHNPFEGFNFGGGGHHTFHFG